jgi:hypothetical protein
VVDPLGIGDTRRLFSERLRQAFMEPWFAWVNIIANRYSSELLSEVRQKSFEKTRIPSGTHRRFITGAPLDCALLHLGYLVRHQAMRLAVYGLGRFLVRGFG